MRQTIMVPAAHSPTNFGSVNAKNHRVFRSIARLRGGATPVRTANWGKTKIRTEVRALPDFVQYTELQLVSWVLPMVIAGRVMDMKYEEIGKGLLALAVFKTCLHAMFASSF